MTNNENDKRLRLMGDVVAPIGLLLVLAATVAAFFLRDSAWAMEAYPYVYAAGAVIVLIARILTPKEKELRIKKLRHMDVWAGIVFCVAAVFLFYPGAALRDWLAFTLAGAVLQIYTSIALPIRLAKSEKEKKD